jgi:signal transduction histidine kinase
MYSIEIAKNAEEAKDDFFRNISHEMRTPLNSILGLTSLLKRRAKDDIKLYDILNVIEHNSQNLANLVESILDLQRLGRGEFELFIKEFETHALYASIITRYESKVTEKNLNFKHAIDPDVPAVLLGDSGRIQQILTALMDNAIKFTPKDGRIDFHLSYSDESSMLICQIQDTGVGIAVEDQEKIFKLAQVDSSLSRKHEGAGIGLTIANTIVQQMNGNVTLHSAPNQGSTFLIELPLKRPTP